MTTENRKVLDQVNVKYGPFEKWHTWAWIFLVIFYFIFPYGVSFFITGSPTLLTLFGSVNFSWYLGLSLAVQYGTTFIIAITCFGKYIWQSIKVFFSHFFANFGKCLLLFMAGFGANMFTSIIISIFNPQNENANEESLNTVSASLPIIMFIIVVLVAPICEELIFRWGIFRPIYKKSPVTAHIVTALLFAFVHVMSAVFSGDYFELINMLAYLPMAFAVSFAYQWTGSIFGAMLIHIGWNLMASLL